MKYLSVCSGIEAASVAWHSLGWSAVAFSEIDPFPCSVLHHRFPQVPNWGDMTRFKEWPDATIDALVGGTPCQSFSMAGLRRGLDDPRGSLMLTYLGIARRYRPRWIVWENVPGVLSSNGGRDFGTFLGALGELGYGWAYRVLDAQFFGVPQRRRRVFVVGCLGDRDASAQVLFNDQGYERCAKEAERKGNLHRSAGDSDDDSGSNGVWWDGGRLSQTLDAVLHKKQCLPEKQRFPVVRVPAWVRCECCEDMWCQYHGLHVYDCRCPPIDVWASNRLSPYEPCVLRYITPVEAERLQGFPDDWTAIPGASDSGRYKSLGNSMAVPVMRWIGERIANVDKTG